jgi:uncharacterized protein
MAEYSQYCYQLKLRLDLLNNDNWTEEEDNCVDAHYDRLKADTERGVVIMAGRTLTTTEEGFGIVVFRATSEHEAREYMENDPAVKNGVMSAKFFPFRVALIQDHHL